MDDRFNILSLSGGGYLGLYTISILAAMEQAAGEPIARKFDLIAGTSVGGIIALALALEIPAIKILEAFKKNGTSIFSDRPAPIGDARNFLDLKRFFFKPKYSDEGLRNTILRLLDDVAGVDEGKDLCMRDLKHRVIVPTVNLTKGGPQVFKTSHHETFWSDRSKKIVDVAIATSAAPTFFPLAKVEDALYADGGLYANAPDLLAVHEAEHFLKIKPENIHVLSVGTTTSKFSFAHVQGRNLGIASWARGQRLINVSLSSQQQIVDYMLKHKMGDRYLRIDTVQSDEQKKHLALDVATEDAQTTLMGLAASAAQETLSQASLRSFLAHNAKTPIFYNLDR